MRIFFCIRKFSRCWVFLVFFSIFHDSIRFLSKGRVLHRGPGERRDSPRAEAARAAGAVVAASCFECTAERRVLGAAVRGGNRLSPEIRGEGVRFFRR